MTVEFSKQVADQMLSDPRFSQMVEDAVKTFNPVYDCKMVNGKGFGLLISKKSEGYLNVSICE